MLEVIEILHIREECQQELLAEGVLFCRVVAVELCAGDDDEIVAFGQEPVAEAVCLPTSGGGKKHPFKYEVNLY